MFDSYAEHEAGIEAAIANGEPAYEWNNTSWFLDTPDQISELREDIALSELAKVKSSAGKVKRSEITTGILTSRNKGYDERAEGLWVDYQTRVEEIKTQNGGLDDAALAQKLASDENLIKIATRIEGLGDNPSSFVNEKIVLGMGKIQGDAQRDAINFMTSVADQEVRASTSALVERTTGTGPQAERIRSGLLSGMTGHDTTQQIDLIEQMFGEDTVEFNGFLEKIGIQGSQNPRTGNVTYTVDPNGAWGRLQGSMTACSY